MVLLTDGENEYPQDNDLGRAAHRHRLRAERCGSSRSRTDAADLDILKKIAAASRAAAYDASDPATITKVFVSVISNF